MFEAFVNMYLKTNGKPTLPPFADKITTIIEQPSGCFVSRKGNKQRMLANHAAVLQMMREELGGAEIQEIFITTKHTTQQVVHAMRSCHVIVGVHGAGMYNTIFASNSAGIVEILPNPGGPPAYYRNINMLLGHFYEGVQGQFRIGERIVIADLDAVRSAVKRAWAYHKNFTDAQYRQPQDSFA
jgi:capsular polysaccharide biosynthesis protein